MKKNFAILFIALIFSTMASALPLRFEENVHYKVVSNISTPVPTLTEYFSYFCQHCYRFEPIAKELENIMPEGAKFGKSHVDFVSRTSKDIQFSLNKAVAAAKTLGMSHKINDAIFDHIHVQRKPFSSEDEIIEVMVKAGADAKKVKSLMNSFGIKNMAKKMKKSQADLTAKNVLTAVPMFIVNGKYKILAEKLRSQDDYNELVLFLLAMK